MLREPGKQIILIGIVIIIAGLLISLRDQLPWIKKLGHLPGDIRIQKENFSFYFPLATSLLISALLSLILYIFKK